MWRRKGLYCSFLEYYSTFTNYSFLYQSYFVFFHRYTSFIQRSCKNGGKLGGWNQKRRDKKERKPSYRIRRHAKRSNLVSFWCLQRFLPPSGPKGRRFKSCHLDQFPAFTGWIFYLLFAFFQMFLMQSDWFPVAFLLLDSLGFKWLILSQHASATLFFMTWIVRTPLKWCSFAANDWTMWPLVRATPPFYSIWSAHSELTDINSLSLTPTDKRTAFD
mgnify:CR=1 FL=1